MNSKLEKFREENQRIITEAFQQRNLHRDHMIHMMGLAKNLFALDRVTLFTNWNYKYQLDCAVIYNAQGVEIDPGMSLLLTQERYQEILRLCTANPFEELSLFELERAQGEGAILPCAILLEEQYFGQISFCAREAREWQQEEKAVLSELSYLVFLYMKLNNLNREFERYDQEKQKFESETVTSGFFLNLQSGTCHALKLASFLEGKTQEWENYQDLINGYVEDYIGPIYGYEIQDKFSLDYLKKNLSLKNPLLSMEFPRMVEGKKDWYRLVVELSRCDEKDVPISAYFYFNDITEEMKLKEISTNLEREHERVLEAELQALTDPLTGAYNRAGFERIVKSFQNEKVPVGFVWIDVDNFKMINDTYGHKFGDEVLELVAKRLMTSFRNEDKVFRFGGDEFALLLHGCHADAWNNLQMKFTNIHHFLLETLKKEIPVTLSAGFSQSDNGFHEELVERADEALYHIKSTGRAGLAQIDKDHKIIYTWHDVDLLDRRSILPKAPIFGKWRVEFQKEGQQKVMLFFDETLHIMLEIPKVLSPEECFECWYDRIVSRHLELYDEMVEKLLNVGNAECVYHWMHPTKGEIALQIVAQSRDCGTSTEINGYMRVVRNQDVVLSYDDGHFLMQALNRLFFCTYYFDLNSGDYYILKGHKEDPNVKEKHKNIEGAFQNYISEYVHPEYQQKVMKFADLSTMSDRLNENNYIDCEYLTITKLGWCSTRVIPVKWDAKGNVTHAVSMSICVDATKKEALEREEMMPHFLKTI